MYRSLRVHKFIKSVTKRPKRECILRMWPVKIWASISDSVYKECVIFVFPGASKRETEFGSEESTDILDFSVFFSDYSTQA